ncbi:unnamed protein product [Soboliphyme baturini]|uniref:glycerol kinase n=1 Tax=Soboliphyme baturini TaxID=241478 RepID=A0A183J5R3_9BILA|nr:unnamed protein product [Soboliphyme baturini]
MKEGKHSLIGAIDQGTSSTRFMLFDSVTRNAICHHQIATTPLHPQKGWFELDPVALLDDTRSCIEKACAKLAEYGYEMSDIKAVGVTNQRETTIAWDCTTGTPLYNAIVWSDIRTEGLAKSICAQFPNEGKDHWKKVTGLPVNPYFSALKLRWLFDNVPAVNKAIVDKRCLCGEYSGIAFLQCTSSFWLVLY